MRKTMHFTLPVLTACCLIVLATNGCEENTTPTQNPPSVDVSGTWGLQADLADVHTMVLNQSGNNLSGYVSSFVGQNSTIAGIISDISVEMLMTYGTSSSSSNTVSNVVSTVNFSGLASDNSMSGSWRNSNGDSGTWTAVRK